MNTTLLLIIIITIIFTVKNISLFKQLSVSKDYKDAYHAVVSRDENAVEKLYAYLDKEKDDYLKNKGRILLIYLLLHKDQDASSILNDLDVNKVFMPKDKYNKNHITLNADMFIWLAVMLPCLNKAGQMDALYEKFNKLDEYLLNHVEYKTFKASYFFMKKDEENSKFLTELVNGEYSGMFYDKQLIGVIKRIALSYIASPSKEKNIEYKDELALFAKSYIGGNMLTDLDIYEVYKPDETN